MDGERSKERKEKKEKAKRENNESLFLVLVRHSHISRCFALLLSSERSRVSVHLLPPSARFFLVCTRDMTMTRLVPIRSDPLPLPLPLRAQRMHSCSATMQAER